MVEAKIHLFRYNESNQPYNCDFFCLLFLMLWNFVLSEYSNWRIIFNSLKNCCLTHLCVFVYIVCLHNVIKWLIWSTAFFFSYRMNDLLHFWWNFRQTTLIILEVGIWIMQKLYIIVHKSSFFQNKDKFPAELCAYSCKKEMARLKAACQLSFFF